MRMLEKAAQNGATHIKVQSIFTKNLVYRPKFEQGVCINSKTYSIQRPFQIEYERLKGLELSWKEHDKFIEVCEQLNVIPLTTCFAHESLSKIIECGFNEVKIASYDCGSHALIKRLKGNFKHIYVSTGASFDDEIIKTSKILQDTNYTLLHCVTKYPLEPSDANINRIEWLKKYCINVGYSDHSNIQRDGLINVLTAIHMGASVIESHFTIKNPEETRDGRVSIDETHLREIAKFSSLNSRDQVLYLDEFFEGWENSLGNQTRTLSNDELLNRDYYRGRFGSRRSDYGQFTSDAYIMNWEQW